MIPNIIHFIYFFGAKSRPFSYFNYLAVKIAYLVQQPDVIYFHCNEEPIGNPHWDNIKQYVKIVKVVRPTEYMGIELEYPQYQADIVRLQILQAQGGIYLDTDTLLLKPLTPLLDKDCVMCYDTSEHVSINNALIMSKPNSEFITNWLNEIPNNFSNVIWAYHAVVLPLKLYKDNPRDLTLLNQEAFAPFGFDDKYIFSDNPADVAKLDNSYAVHLWDTIWNDELGQVNDDYLNSRQNLFTRLFKKYRNERTMKIAVYAISKNEEQFVRRFCESSKEADIIVIADTGSTDRTVELARECGATVHSIYVNPWRFDKARDTALALIPADVDVCISLDLDEELQPGWREEIERVWTKDTTRLRYKFDWGVGIVFYYEKIHHRKGYHWHHPCHEYPRPDSRITEVWAQTDMLLAIHKPDPTKSRGQYMDLLQLAVDEDPRCPRNAFYYARELTFYERWLEAAVALNKYLEMPEATWPNERCYAMRLMAKAYEALNQNGKTWLHNACTEAPNTREPWIELADICHKRKEWQECYNAVKSALAIKDKALVYTMDPSVWGARPHDLLALSAYNLELYDEALEHGQLAVDLEPNDPRLHSNLEYYRTKVNSSS